MFALILTLPSLNSICPKLQHSFGGVLDKSLLVRSELIVTVQANWWENLNGNLPVSLSEAFFPSSSFYYALKTKPKQNREGFVQV